MIGTQGSGKSTISKLIRNNFGDNVEYYTQHDYKTVEEFFMVLLNSAKNNITSSDKIIIVDRCNVKVSSRKEITDKYTSIINRDLINIIFVDFINDNDKISLANVVFKRAKERCQDDQQLKYNPQNDGKALRMVINKKLKQYEHTNKDECVDVIIKVNMKSSCDNTFKYVRNVIRKQNGFF